jgi:hypothetical protein
MDVVELVAQVGVERIRGGYLWVAEYADGTTVEQWEPRDGVWHERSIATLHAEPIARIVLYPIYLTHKPVVIELADNVAWLKVFTRQGQITLPPEIVEQDDGDDGNVVTVPVDPDQDRTIIIDKIELRSPDAVRLYIYPDGSIKLTTGEP